MFILFALMCLGACGGGFLLGWLNGFDSGAKWERECLRVDERKASREPTTDHDAVAWKLLESCDFL
jgi:hypothetical protein